MVIDFGENIMTVLMVVGSIVAIMMVIACALISYSFKRVFEKQAKFDKEFNKWHY